MTSATSANDAIVRSNDGVYSSTISRHHIRANARTDVTSVRRHSSIRNISRNIDAYIPESNRFCEFPSSCSCYYFEKIIKKFQNFKNSISDVKCVARRSIVATIVMPIDTCTATRNHMNVWPVVLAICVSHCYTRTWSRLII